MYDFTIGYMWNLLIILIVSQVYVVEGNRVLSDTVIIQRIVHDSTDREIANGILHLYLDYGFPFARVKITRIGDSIRILIKEGPLAQLEGIEIEPQKYRGLMQILPAVKGKIFRANLLKIIKSRVNSVKFLKFQGIEFRKGNSGIILVVKARRVDSPARFLMSLSVANKRFVGFSNFTTRDLLGRPGLSSLQYSQVKEGSRNVLLKFELPYIKGSPMGLYAGYHNNLFDSDFSIVYRAGYDFRSEHMRISNGFMANETPDGREYFAEFAGEGGISWVNLQSRLIYRSRKYRATLKFRVQMKRVEFYFYGFRTRGAEFDAEDLGGPLFLHGYPYGFSKATNGEILKIDVRIYRWFHLFTSFGYIESSRYLSYGLAILTPRGQIFYGLNPGAEFYNGILTVSLKIAL